MDYSEAVVRLEALNIMYGPFEAIEVAIKGLQELIKEADDGK